MLPKKLVSRIGFGLVCSMLLMSCNTVSSLEQQVGNCTPVKSAAQTNAATALNLSDLIVQPIDHTRQLNASEVERLEVSFEKAIAKTNATAASIYVARASGGVWASSKGLGP